VHQVIFTVYTNLGYHSTTTYNTTNGEVAEKAMTIVRAGYTLALILAPDGSFAASVIDPKFHQVLMSTVWPEDSADEEAGGSLFHGRVREMIQGFDVQAAHDRRIEFVDLLDEALRG
jgi:hypothetical protein